MKILLYFHDAALPHSRYLLQAFSNQPRVSQLTVCYPEARGEDVIFSAQSNTTAVAIGNDFESLPYKMLSLKSMRLRPKWVSFMALFQAIKSEKPDYVIVLDEALCLNTLFAGIAVKLAKLNAPVVCYGFENIHQTPPWVWLKKNGLSSLPSFLRKTLRYLLLDRLLHPIRKKVVSGALVSYIECVKVIRQSHWPLLPIKEQWWGVDVTLFSKANNEFQERPAIWKSTKDQFVIGFVGRFVSEKGVSDLIHSIAALDSRYLLVCIGAGPEKESYIRLAKDLQVFNQLLILPPMPATELANHIAAMNLLALPSHTQTFWKEQYGRVLVEAMAAKIPVIGSRSGAIPYVINDPSCTFQEGDTQGICAAILNALSKTGAQKDALRDRAKLGDANQFAQGFFDLYDQLVKT
jgi:glycosyltransferase involved in cell wall biosynthesis